MFLAVHYADPAAKPDTGDRMSHMIEDNMIAFKGATPWHGLGVAVDASMDGVGMLKAAKLDWQVQRRALAMRDAVGSKDTLLTEPLKGYRAIVRAGTDQVFQVSTDRYHPLQNAEVVDFFKAYCDAGHATMETVGGLQGGSKVWALARLNGGSGANLQGVDEQRGYMLLATSHDGSLRTIGKPTSVRVVCWNTLSAALFGVGQSTGEFRMKHTRKWTPAVAREAQSVMGMAIEALQAQNELSDKLARVRIDDAGRLEFVRRVLSGGSIVEEIISESPVPANALDAILNGHEVRDTPVDLAQSRAGKAILEAIVSSPGADLVTARNTLWGAVNGVSYWTDHQRGRGQDTRLSSAWFGDSNNLKQTAVSVARDMAGVN